MKETQKIKINTFNYLAGRLRDVLNIIYTEEAKGWKYTGTQVVDEQITYLLFEKEGT